MSRHAQYCKGDKSFPIKISMLSQTLDERFKSEIISSLRNDSIGALCERDEAILRFGNYLFKGKKMDPSKAVENRKSVRNQMRQLARLYIQFTLTNPLQKYFNIIDMFNKDNFSSLLKSIEELSTGDKLKPGLKLSLYYCILSAAKYFHVEFLQHDELDKAEMLQKFISVLKINEKIHFMDARLDIDLTRQRTLRKPSELPLSSDLDVLKKYLRQTIKDISSRSKQTEINVSEYINLRNCLCSRLTLLNGRRGGEAARLLTKDFQEGCTNQWIDSNHYQKLDPLERQLVDQVKICYQTGKGNKRLVPLLIPNECLNGMEILLNERYRTSACISKDNPFLFAPTNTAKKNLHGHISGWHVLKEVCKSLSLSSASSINATKNRHYVSTIYATLHVADPKERQYFFDHMGHAEEMNKNNYQCPPAIMAITKVGKHLLGIDNCELLLTNTIVLECYNLLFFFLSLSLSLS